MRAPFRTSLRRVDHLSVVEVALAWSDGRVTTAEVSPTPEVTGDTAASIEGAVMGPIADAVTGIGLDAHEEILLRLQGALVANTTAKCAVDLAVHSALAAEVGGWGPLMGGVPGPVRTDVTISLAEPGTMAEVSAARVEEGFDVLKLKLGGGGTGQDVDRALAVHEAVGGRASLRLDANQAWTGKDTLKLLDRLSALGIELELVEQPVPAWDLEGLAMVRRHGHVPVLADESVRTARDVFRLAEAGAADLVNLKLAKCGGLRPARDVVATAAACGLGVVVGCMLEPPATVAVAARLACLLPTKHAHDLDAVWWAGDDGSAVCRPPNVLPIGR